MATTFVIKIGDPDPDLYNMTNNVPRVNRNIDFNEVSDWAEKDEIWANRGKAIQGYAQLEDSLCRLFAALGDIPPATARTVFFKMTSTGSRNSILEKLLHAKHGQKFNPFWNSYLNKLRNIDTTRNEIVHWLAAANAKFDDQNILRVGVTLIPPGAPMAAVPSSSPRLISLDLRTFANKCDEFAHLANMFAISTNPLPNADSNALNLWLEIFQQPLVYPLPYDHLLFQKAIKP